MTTILFLIEPCPPAPHEFLELAAREPDSPVPRGMRVRRVEYMPHAYVGVVTLRHGDADDLRNALGEALVKLYLSGQLGEQHTQIYNEVRVNMRSPALTFLDILNVDMRGLPLGVDRPFPPPPEWSARYSEGKGLDVIRRGAIIPEHATFPDEPEDSMFPPEPDLPEDENEWRPIVLPEMPILPEDPVSFEASPEVQYIPDLDLDETRDLTVDELRLFRPDHETDPWWPDAKIFDF